jgi:hypothetical protein
MIAYNFGVGELIFVIGALILFASIIIIGKSL